MRANTLICLITGGRRKPSIWRGLLAGIAGGVAGSVAISQFHALAGRWVKNSQPQQQGEDSTVKAASAVSETILDRPLEPNEKKPASQAVHYAFGTGVGAAYGALAEWKPAVARAAGAPFGLPAARWMLEIGAAFMRTETELILKSRRVTPSRLLEHGFVFDFPIWRDAALDLSRQWKLTRER